MQYRAASSKKNRSARLIGFCPMSGHYFFYASHCSAFQTDFDPMRMSRRFGENIFDNTLRQFACALILFQDDEHGYAGFNGGASLTVHIFSISDAIRKLMDIAAR